MERNIFFRGWAKNEQKWIKGSLVVNPDDNNEILYYDEEDGWMTDYITSHTQGQWTGTVDADGNKIFEDDILKEVDGSNRYVVVFNAGCFMLLRITSKRDARPRTKAQWMNYRVIGNSFENHELLSKEDGHEGD